MPPQNIQLLTEEDIAAIAISDAEIGRGEFVDSRTFAAEMRKKYCVKRSAKKTPKCGGKARPKDRG
jgi:hypothetical protein